MKNDRNRLVRIVAAVAVVAIFVMVWHERQTARSSTDALLARLADGPPADAGSPAPPDGAPGTTPPPTRTNPTDGPGIPPSPSPSGPRLTPHERQALIDGNPFRISPEQAPPPATPSNPPPVEAPPPPPPRPHRLTLVGTIFGSEGGYAVIRDDEARLEDYYAPGARVSDRATLVSVARNMAVVQVDGRSERLEVDWNLAATPPPRAPAEPLASRATFRPSAATVEMASTDGADASAVSVSRDDLNQNFRNLSQLLTQMRVQPFFESGKPAGFLVSSVKQGSFVERLGAKSGDVIRSVNGQQIDSVKKAFELYNAFKNDSAVQVTVTRGGRPHTLNFAMQ